MTRFRPSDSQPMPPVLKNLIIINVIVYIAQLFLDSTYNITGKLLLYPIMPHRLYDILLSQHAIESSDKFQVYQIITHMFAHSPQMMTHIIFNMLTLWIFGEILERIWGSKRFLNFYLICGIGAAILQLAMQYYRCEMLLQAIDANDQEKVARYIGAISPALGASGAIMGIMVAFAYLFPNTPLYFMFLPIPIKAKWIVIGYVAYDLFGGTYNSGDHIAHFAHLGGAITGFIMILIWNKSNRRNFY